MKTIWQPLLLSVGFSIAACSRMEDEAVSVVTVDLQILSVALREFQRINGRLPTDDEGLRALVERPSASDVNWRQILEGLKDDPWRRPYQYTVSKLSPRGYHVFSRGPGPLDSGDDVYLK